jgi:hypothetical protein
MESVKFLPHSNGHATTDFTFCALIEYMYSVLCTGSLLMMQISISTQWIKVLFSCSGIVRTPAENLTDVLQII